MTGPVRAPRVGMAGSVGRRTTAGLLRAACDGRLEVVDLVGHTGDPAPGIAAVTTLAGGDAGLVTQVTTAVRSLPRAATIVLNVDDDHLRDLAGDLVASVVRVSAEDVDDVEVAARDVRLDARARARFAVRTPWGDADVVLPVAGRHHVTNALAALAAAGAAGIDLASAAAALATAELRRGTVREVAGLVLLDDTGHATTVSVLAALEALHAMQVAGQRVGVLGTMDAPPEAHETEHWRIGMRAARILDRLVVVGAAATPITAGARDAAMPRVEVVDDAAGALQALTDVGAGDAVLVKGGVDTGLEAVVAGLVDRRRAQGAGS